MLINLAIIMCGTVVPPCALYRPCGSLHRSKPVVHSGSIAHKSAIIIMCGEKPSCATFLHSIGPLRQ